jgi:3-dehydroquinate synthase
MTGSADETETVTRVPVALAERSYDILIGAGLIANAGASIAARFPGRAVAIVTDETVGALHAPALEAGLTTAGIRHHRITVPAGEATKRFAMLEQVVDQILGHRLERGDIVLALGGGVVGDLAGFAAAIVRRGMGFVQMPTSLLAQVDSSVGGKTGINSRHGKNLIGAFYQPGLVLADTDALDTLSTREFRAGYAEVAKYGLIDDPGFFAWLEAHWRGVFQGGRDRVHAIATSCRAKAAVVARDETETGDRALLNLGHTFGHALEAVTGYDGARLVHGEGVAIGMCQAFRFSAKLGLCAPVEAVRMAAHLSAVGLPTEVATIPGGVGDVDALMNAIAQDKKVARGKLTFILARGIGESFIAKDVDPQAVRDFLGEELERA